MKRIVLGAVAIGALFAVTAPAQARDGCGKGFHRGPQGRCWANNGPGWSGPPGRPGVVVGTYYPGRGYYYNGRYWRHRERHRDGWRYR